MDAFLRARGIMAVPVARLHFLLCFPLIIICLVLPATSVGAIASIDCPENSDDLAIISYTRGVEPGYYRDRFHSWIHNNSSPIAIMGSDIELLENAEPCNQLSCSATILEDQSYFYNMQRNFNQNKGWQLYPPAMQDRYNFTAKDTQFSPCSFSFGMALPDIEVKSDEKDHKKHYLRRRDKATDGKCLPGYENNPCIPRKNKRELFGCPSNCGDIRIPYPFGIRAGCHRPGFRIACDESTTPPKAILSDDIQVLGFNMSSAETRVSDIFLRQAAVHNNSSGGNNFTVIFFEGFVLIYTSRKSDQEQYYASNENSNSVRTVVLDWAIRTNGTCLASHVESSIINPACQSKHSRCVNTTNSEGYVCKCLQGYEGNPYIPNGCLDVNEHKLPDGSEDDSIATNRSKNSVKFPYPAGVAISSVLGVTILLGLYFLVTTCRRHKRHIKENEGYQRYYQMMAGRLRVFSKRQIEVATNNFDESRILGTGGQGKVFMGYLEDSKPAAIKIPKVINNIGDLQIAEFVNEIILLSQINHKNIVGLLGCCVEVDAPILVYEFVPNGTLQELLHGFNRNRPIPSATRLKIALESAEALDYLHSSITQSILHGDFKSANILLEDDYRAKVSDFGASNLVPVDDTHVVKDVQGTRGYIDPEYFHTGVLTKKSDVYSFGVVLLELITRRYAIFRDQTSAEMKNLALCFVSSWNENKLSDLLDKDIINNDENVIKVLQEASQLAVRCVSAKGEDRPTMKQIVEKLQCLVRLQSSLMIGLPNIPEGPEDLLDESMYYTTSDTFAFDSVAHSSVLEIEVPVS